MTYSLWVSKRHRHPGPPICATGALERIGGPSGRRQAPKNKSVPNPLHRPSIVGGKPMRKARNILALIVRIVSADPVYSSHGRHVI